MNTITKQPTLEELKTQPLEVELLLGRGGKNPKWNLSGVNLTTLPPPQNSDGFAVRPIIDGKRVTLYVWGNPKGEQLLLKASEAPQHLIDSFKSWTPPYVGKIVSYLTLNTFGVRPGDIIKQHGNAPPRKVLAIIPHSKPLLVVEDADESVRFAFPWAHEVVGKSPDPVTNWPGNPELRQSLFKWTGHGKPMSDTGSTDQKLVGWYLGPVDGSNQSICLLLTPSGDVVYRWVNSLVEMVPQKETLG